jgi:hypothetical protein
MVVSLGGGRPTIRLGRVVGAGPPGPRCPSRRRPAVGGPASLLGAGIRGTRPSSAAVFGVPPKTLGIVRRGRRTWQARRPACRSPRPRGELPNRRITPGRLVAHGTPTAGTPSGAPGTCLCVARRQAGALPSPPSVLCPPSSALRPLPSVLCPLPSARPRESPFVPLFPPTKRFVDIVHSIDYWNPLEYNSQAMKPIRGRRLGEKRLNQHTPPTTTHRH